MILKFIRICCLRAHRVFYKMEISVVAIIYLYILHLYRSVFFLNYFSEARGLMWLWYLVVGMFAMLFFFLKLKMYERF